MAAWLYVADLLSNTQLSVSISPGSLRLALQWQSVTFLAGCCNIASSNLQMKTEVHLLMGKSNHRFLWQIQVHCRNEKVFSYLLYFNDFPEKGLKQSMGYCPWHHFITSISMDFLCTDFCCAVTVSFFLEASSDLWNVITCNFSHQLEAMRVRIAIGPRASKPFALEQCPAGTRPAQRRLWEILSSGESCLF